MTGQRQPSLPPKITGFEYVGLLGMGGFADVFEYRQDFPRRSVAVKVLLASSVDQGARDGFFSEANIMAGLSQHPSIVTIHQAAIASDGRPYFVMEYCSKPSLGARFRNERISVAEVLRTGIRVASAVETAHRLGVLHRDIKPANILATDFGWPALTDFGIAGTVGDKLAAAGMSIPWAPPELISDHPTGDARSDVYSLAATLYSLLAGKSPFEYSGKSNSPLDLMTRIERDPVRPVDRVDVPQDLNSVLARGMSKRPEHRYSSALAFAHALQNIEREMQLPVTGIDVTDMGPHRTSHNPVDPAPVPPAPGTAQQNWGKGQVQEGTILAANSQQAPDDDEATRLRSVVTVDAQPINEVGESDSADNGFAPNSAHRRPAGQRTSGKDGLSIDGSGQLGSGEHGAADSSVYASSASGEHLRTASLENSGNEYEVHHGTGNDAAEVETRLRPVTTINFEKKAHPPAAQEYVPESGRTTTASPHSVGAADLAPHVWARIEDTDHEQAVPRTSAIFEPKQFDETTGSTGYFYKKRVQADAEAKQAGKRITFLVSLASILLLVGVLVYIGLNGLGKKSTATPMPEPTVSATTPTVTVVPEVQELTVLEQDAQSVTFTWKNPDPQPDDAYVWRVVDATQQGTMNRITENNVSVPRESQTQSVCIEVSLVRANGTMSHTAAKGCN